MKSRFFKYIAIPIMVIGSLSSCEDEFLDRAATTQLQDQDIFSTFVMTDQVVNNLYRKTRGPLTFLAGHNMGSATDESKDASSWMASNRFNNGSWSGNNNPIGNTWRDNYVGIRQANQILEGIKTYSTPDDPNNPGFLNNRIGEVYFLRAWFLAEQIRQFGGAIIVTKTLAQNDEVGLNMPRNTYDECVAQIIADCDEAYSRVAFTYPNEQIGRVTKGACLALKARMLLYAASPLWAEAGKTSWQADISNNKTASDPNKWQRAANASKAVIDLVAPSASGPMYALEPSLAARQNMFKQQGTLISKEVIWIRRDETNDGYDRYIFPFGSSGWSGAAPTQNLVDDYEMKNGLPISDPASGYDPMQPYKDRDPRFYTDISYNGADWKGRKIETFAGGRDEASTQTDRSRTGYYMRKLADESMTIGQTSRGVHGIHFRLAEFYLSYAEALNEYNPGHADVLRYVNLVRERSGLAALPAGLTQAEMRARIRNERRIELAFENHRFWDVRRWKIASETEPSIWGMRPVRDANTPTGFRYDRFKVEERPWRNVMYVIPITTDETLRNRNLIQNEGW